MNLKLGVFRMGVRCWPAPSSPSARTSCVSLSRPVRRPRYPCGYAQRNSISVRHTLCRTDKGCPFWRRPPSVGTKALRRTSTITCILQPPRYTLSTFTRDVASQSIDLDSQHHQARAFGQRCPRCCLPCNAPRSRRCTQNDRTGDEARGHCHARRDEQHRGVRSSPLVVSLEKRWWV